MEKRRPMPESSDEEDEFAEGNKKDQAHQAKKKAYAGEGDQQTYDDVLTALFERVEPGEGDEFAAVKPWLGAIKEPKSHPKPSKKAPKEDYHIDWVYGYRSEEARMNAQFSASGNAVYPTAALGVVFDYKKMKQTYFGGGKTKFSGRKQLDEGKDGHTDDVTSLCLSFSRRTVASGQNGQKPLVFLWDADTAAILGKKRLPKGSRLVTAIGISATDKYVCASDAAEKITAHVFAVDGGEAAIATIAINMKIVHLAWSPNTEEAFATAGKDHVAICSVAGNKITKKMGKSSGGNIISQCSAAWANNKSYANHILTGGSDGKIYHWIDDKVKQAYDNNKGSVHSIALRADQSVGGEVALVGGNDKTLTVYKFDGKLSKLWQIVVDAAPRSVDLFNGNVLLGLKNGSLVELPFQDDRSKTRGPGKPNVVMTSHCDGEVWGLDVVTLDNGGIRIITSADDNRILAYDAKTHQALAEGVVGEASKKKAKKGYRGGASSMSSSPAECQSRSVAFNAALGHLAVSNNKGIVTIREIDWAAVDSRAKGALDNVKKTVFKEIKKAEWIEAMSYSPCNKYLAVGSHDNTVYLLDTKTYKKATKLTGHSSFITAVDWAQDSSFIRSVCGAYELLFFNIGKKKRDPSGASNTIETVWSDQSCKLGWNVQGIFPSGCDGSHINSCCMSKDQSLIASGDDYGLVCTYKNPLLEGHDSNKYRGHSEHVTHVKFSDDHRYLVSTGGQDQTTIQWKLSK